MIVVVVSYVPATQHDALVPRDETLHVVQYLCDGAEQLFGIIVDLTIESVGTLHMHSLKPTPLPPAGC